MSWSIHGIENPTPIAEARAKIAAQLLPPEIAVHVSAALDGIVLYFPDDDNLHVVITGYGHLCEGAGSFPVTTVTLKIERVIP